MSKTWKWIIGIVLGLVVLAGLGFAAAIYFGFGHMAFLGGPGYAGRPMMNGYGFNNRGPVEGFRDFRQPMMGGRGYGAFGYFGLPFLFFGGLFRLVIPLIILALAIFFSYRAGKRAGMKTVQATPVAAPVTDSKPQEPPEGTNQTVV